MGKPQTARQAWAQAPLTTTALVVQPAYCLRQTSTAGLGGTKQLSVNALFDNYHFHSSYDKHCLSFRMLFQCGISL